MSNVRYNPPPPEEIRDWLSYDMEAGKFIWARQSSPKFRVGDEATGTIVRGQRRIKVRGRYYTASRLSWWFVHGEWPEQLIGHRSRDRTDDRITNLRLSSHGINAISSIRATGRTGVYAKPNGRFYARIMVDNKMIPLGGFDTPEEAARAYDAAAEKYWGEFAVTNAALGLLAEAARGAPVSA